MSHHPAIVKAWNQKGKDCYHLEQNHTARINHTFGELTKYIQCLPVTFLVSLGGSKVYSSSGLVWQSCAVAVCDHPLNCWSGGLIRLTSTYSQVRSILHACKEVHWLWSNESLTHHELDTASTSPVHAWAFVPNPKELIQQSQLMVDSSALMAVQSSDLDDQKPGATVQTEDHTLTPLNGQIVPQETEASSSTPSHSPSQSLARKQTPDHPETWFCLEIQVTSSKDGGTTPPPPHVWHASRWQIWPYRNGCDRPRPDHPILWKKIPRRRT